MWDLPGIVGGYFECINQRVKNCDDFPGWKNPSEKKNVSLSWKNVYFLEQQIQIQSPKKKFLPFSKRHTHLHRTYDKIVVGVVDVVVQAITPSHRLLPLSLSNLIDKQRKVTDRVSWNFRVVALQSLLLFLGAFSSE